MSLVIRNLGKHYGETPVFTDINLTVEPGEFVAIVGESGVGKSSLLNCMAALDHWNAGSIHHGDQDLGKLNEVERAHWRRANLGFVFQAFHVLPHLDVAQNVGLPLLLLKRRDPDRVEEMLHAVGLSGLGDRLPAQLSGGQLQRVAIARAMVHKPRLLLADEPTGNLDPRTAVQVMDVLEEQAHNSGASLLLVTHSTSAAARAGRTLLLTPTGLIAAHTE